MNRLHTTVFAMTFVAFLAGSLIVGAAAAGERPIGEPIEKNGMEIAAVYLQPVKMEPALPQSGAFDIHLEADIHAITGNENGFGGGEWVPYLGVSYQIQKRDSDWTTFGAMIPMVASDGPHYGDNLRLDGPGTYTLTFTIHPPIRSGLYRHTDRETGVGRWWTPFTTQWTFAFLGAGKKGGY